MTSAIDTDINAFVASQNQNRGKALAGGEALALDYNALSGTVPAGGNAVTGVAGIAAGAAAISLPAGQNGNTLIVDGGISTAASTSGADSYSLLVSSAGAVTLTDNNTGNSEAISGASYILFDGAAVTSTGAYQSLYIVEAGVGAEIASMYNAALGRVPDLAGLEFYIDQFGTWALPDLHTAATYFVTSPEFKALYPALQTPSDNGGPKDQAFISELYGNILHRTPTAADIQFYVQAMQGTLTTSSGAAIPAADRATLLEYFTSSPENQADISASNGGWLINPANGAVTLGSLSTATATTLLTGEAASGTINASDFGGLSSSAQVGIPGAAGPSGTTGVGIVGADVGAGTAAQQADPEIFVSLANETVNLSSQYFLGAAIGANDVVNGVPTGGSIIETASTYSVSPFFNNGGVVNLSSTENWVVTGNPSYAVSVATVVNGWNATDIIERFGNEGPAYNSPAATLLANHNATVLQGSAASPINGASYAGTSTTASPFFTTQFAVNVGAIADDTVASMVTAANQVYKVGDISQENILFFGQDPHGNTMVWYWRGDQGHTGTVQASDITGGLELVGVPASSLTSANFHH